MVVIGNFIDMIRTFLHILCYKLCDKHVKELIDEDVQMYKKYCHLEILIVME